MVAWRVAARLRGQGGQPLTFWQLFEDKRSRQEVIITFLAVLQMVKLRLLRVAQDEGTGEISLEPNGDALERP